MKNLFKKERFLLLVLVAPFVFLARVWPQIPERVPIHFNAAFVADGWMEKLPGALLLPVSNAFVVLVVRLWFLLDPKMSKCSAETRAQVSRVLRQCLATSSLFMSSLSIAIVWAAWGRPEAVVQVTIYGLPLLLVVLGNGMGKLRPNHTIGIRVPWTLKSATVWNRTHRLAGWLLVAVGLFLIGLAALGLPPEIYIAVFLSLLVVWAAVAIIYAYLQSRAEADATAPNNSPAR